MDRLTFSQLFGEADDENDVAPDSNDPELAKDAAAAASAADPSAASAGDPEPPAKRKSTRKWAEECGFDPVALFTKVSSDPNYASHTSFTRLPRGTVLLCFPDEMTAIQLHLDLLSN